MMAAPIQHPPSPATIVTELVHLQRKRRFCITSQSRCDRSIESLIASGIGYRLDADEKDRKVVFARAKEFRVYVEAADELARLVEDFENDRVPQNARAKLTAKRARLAAIVAKGGEQFGSNAALASLKALIVQSAEARGGWDVLRKNNEATMEALAEQLPIAEWAAGIRGLGSLGVAVIVAEAGIPICDYRTVSGLWKRLGLAVIGGERQQRKTGAEAAAAHGYSPGRRAQVWSICSDSLFRAQWAGDKDADGKDPKKTGNPVAIPAHPIGPYGDVYAARRAHTEPRIETTAEDAPAARWTKGRCHNDARRVMTKRLLADMWEAWRRAEGMPTAPGWRAAA